MEKYYTGTNVYNFLYVLGDIYEKIGEMFAKQPKNDLHPLLYQLWLYKGLIDIYPDVWHVSIYNRYIIHEFAKTYYFTSHHQALVTPNLQGNYIYILSIGYR